MTPQGHTWPSFPVGHRQLLLPVAHLEGQQEPNCLPCASTHLPLSADAIQCHRLPGGTETRRTGARALLLDTAANQTAEIGAVRSASATCALA